MVPMIRIASMMKFPSSLFAVRTQSAEKASSGPGVLEDDGVVWQERRPSPDYS